MFRRFYTLVQCLVITVPGAVRTVHSIPNFVIHPHYIQVLASRQ